MPDSTLSALYGMLDERMLLLSELYCESS